MSARLPSAGALWHRLRSRDTALALLALVLLATLLGTLIPQQGITPPQEYAGWQQDHASLAAALAALGLTRVYTAWWFILLLAVLAASLASCTYSRARVLLRRPQARRGQRAARTLHAGRTRRLWGSVVLHVAFVVVLLGGLLSATLRSSGYFELAEGQRFIDAAQSYQALATGPLFQGRHSGLAVQLDRFSTSYWPDGSLRQAESAVALSFPSGAAGGQPAGDGAALPRIATVDAGGPLRFSGLALYQTKTYGLAPVLALVSAAGEVRSIGAVNFATPRDPKQPAVATFSLPETALLVHAQLFPVFGVQPTIEEWRAEDLPNAGLYVTVRRGADAAAADGGAVLYAGPLLVGHEARFAGMTLRFVRLVRWSGYRLVYDPGVPLIFGGFALCAAGAALLYVRNWGLHPFGTANDARKEADANEPVGAGRQPVLAGGHAVRHRRRLVLGGAGLP